MDIYLGLGSNLGDRRTELTHALERLPSCGVRVVRVSPVVESPAMLPDDAPADWNRPFLNVVAHCTTESSPEVVLDGLQAIERELGRLERGRWAPRPIDLDILLWGRETIVSDRLRVPHPGLLERNQPVDHAGAPGEDRVGRWQALGAALFVEIIFSWPGLGLEIYKSVVSRDMPMMLGLVLFSTIVFVLLNLVVDIIYRIINPRVREA